MDKFRVMIGLCKNVAVPLAILVLTGCGGDSGVGNGDGLCVPTVLTGDYVIRSSEDATRLERDGGCDYSIVGSLEITRTRLRVFESLNL